MLKAVCLFVANVGRMVKYRISLSYRGFSESDLEPYTTVVP